MPREIASVGKRFLQLQRKVLSHNADAYELIYKRRQYTQRTVLAMMVWLYTTTHMQPSRDSASPIIHQPASAPDQSSPDRSQKRRSWAEAAIGAQLGEVRLRS